MSRSWNSGGGCCVALLLQEYRISLHFPYSNRSWGEKKQNSFAFKQPRGVTLMGMCWGSTKQNKTKKSAVLYNDVDGHLETLLRILGFWTAARYHSGGCLISRCYCEGRGGSCRRPCCPILSGQCGFGVILHRFRLWKFRGLVSHWSISKLASAWI